MSRYNIDLSNNWNLRLQLYPDDLAVLDDQTEELCLIALRINGNALQYVKQQTTKLCLAAVRQYPYALRHVVNQTEDICWAAIKGDLTSVTLIRNPTEELLEYVIPRYPELFYLFPYHTIKLCELAKARLGRYFDVNRVKGEHLQVLVSL